MKHLNSNVPHSKIEISVRCTDLPKMDIFSKSDPFFVFYIKNSNYDKDWTQVKISETIQNDHNPIFSDKVYLTYLFESFQLGKIEIYDSDPDGKRTFIGYYQFVLGELISSQILNLPRYLLDKNDKKLVKKSIVHLHIQEVAENSTEINLNIFIKNAPKYGFLFKTTKPMKLEFYRPVEGNLDNLTYRSNLSSSHLWNNINIGLFKLCGGNKNNKLKIKILKLRKLCGISYFRVSELYKVYNEKLPSLNLNVYDLNNKCIKKILVVIKVNSILDVYSFFEFIQSGMQINLITSIDFTFSNGYPPSSPSSLHNTNQELNQYVAVINHVGRILIQYDYDKFVTAYGFGAKLTPNSATNHCFNLRDNNKQCFGIDGVMKSYYERVNSVQFHGPTNFSPTITNATKSALDDHENNLEYAQKLRANANKSKPEEMYLSYSILVIITDGLITDLEQTTKAIVDASYLPISIIIIGVGNADFTSMEYLDGDVNVLSFGNKKSVRDIVQFVAMKPYFEKKIPWTQQSDMLAAEVLAEIPEQVTSYMKIHKLIPVKIVD
ncbi:hypothetical protein A3Q56_05346 [Intoshia linei]|uniref:C2 domain-containing protein n=1 Tax=Intoshia linei TaxID=1819745 RepID=A0A177AYI7_9BILA|nr:hypothetical protein A3Q56_05346 [Intoshia linei]